MLNHGPHSEACEPSHSVIGAEGVKREIIGMGSLGSQKPLRIVSDAISGVSDEVLSALPTRSSLLQVARNAKKRMRNQAYREGEGGAVPNCRSLEELAFPQELSGWADGERFPLYDSGAGPERIVIFGAQAGSAPSGGPRRGARMEHSRRLQRCGCRSIQSTR